MSRNRKPASRGGQPQQQRPKGNVSVSYQEMQMYAGPLPQPKDLQGYEDVSPGAAQLILQNFAAQSTHRRIQEDRVVGGSESRSGRGQVFAFIILMTSVIGGCVVAIAASGPAGAAIVGSGLGTGVLAYVVGGRPPKSGT